MKRLKIPILITIIGFWCCLILSFAITCGVKGSFDIRYLLSRMNALIFLLLFTASIAVGLLYYRKHYWLLNSKNIIKGKESDEHINANLEQSRFQSEDELASNFVTLDYRDLATTDTYGIPIKAEEKRGQLKVTFSKPAHTMVIGTTGSGKTTSYVNPTIQILAELKAKPSMLISDPKGELYTDHVEALRKRGYEVKVLDLRNPYNSVRWNPLERIYGLYQRSLHLEDEVEIDEELGQYRFDGHVYYKLEEKDSAVQVKKQLLLDTVYEDLNDICSVLCPINNKNEPMWESGAKNFVLAIALAMLEDSEKSVYGMSKEKYNFYSLMKVATNTDDDCKELINYFKGRSPLSKCVSLSKQVLDSSDKTRGSYLSSVFDKISMFSDLSLCALTSTNEIEFGEMGDKPIALFLQIPDEKETRYTLASMVILQAYKELVYKANTYDSLCLPRPVYFILDEFGNLPKIHKLETMITVGRSRNIWINLIVQSYAQLAKVYDEKTADIIKSNCNIQIFIGTTDLTTIEEFSKRCGNYSVIQRSVGFNSVKGEDINSNQSVKERPLIYPSELQRINNYSNMGNAIVTVFGYYPIRSRFTPSYKCSLYDMKRTKQEFVLGRYFDEAKAFYDIKGRNSLVIKAKPSNEFKKSQMSLVMLKGNINQLFLQILTPEEIKELEDAICKLNRQKAMLLIDKGRGIAQQKNRIDKVELIEDVKERVLDYINENQKY